MTLIGLLLLGAPEGKTELIEGRVLRAVAASQPDEARRWFAALAREACTAADVPWSPTLIDGRDQVDIDRLHLHLRLHGVWVELEVDVSRATWERFA
jgi:hypothetical protein